MSDKAQSTPNPEPLDLKILGSMPVKEALPLIMEQYQVDEDRALLLWISNGPPTGFEDVIRLPPEERAKYVEEIKRTSLGSFTREKGKLIRKK